jgi:flagellar hook protein FlgE
MSFTSSASITGPQFDREAFDASGISRPAREGGEASFSQVLNDTIAKPSQPACDINRDEAVQPGHPAKTNEIRTGMSQGKIVNTGNALDLAIEGDGCFVLTDGQRDVYTRTGSFAVDADLSMFDPATGYRLKRAGSEGEIEGFQAPGNSSVRIPYGMPLPAKATSDIAVSGNLSANATYPTPQRQKIVSDMAYTYDNGTPADKTTRIGQVDQYSGVFASGTVIFGGFHKNGEPLDADISLPVDQTTTVGDIIGHLNSNVLDGATASLANGRIQVTDDAGGYSKTDMTMLYSGEGSLATPAYFEMLTPGAEQSSNLELTIYDSQGGKHALSTALVRTSAPNTWDMVLASVSGEVSEIAMPDRRINAITFDADTGSYTGMNGSDPAQFVITFANDRANPQTIRINLGTAGKLNGLTQFAGNSTAAAISQDGYGTGVLSTVAINSQGVLVGTFSNGTRKNIGALQIATFRNAAALERAANGYYLASAGSGMPLVGRAMTGRAGVVRNGALEKSATDVETDFVSMIQAQNGYRPDSILRESTGLVG